MDCEDDGKDDFERAHADSSAGLALGSIGYYEPWMGILSVFGKLNIFASHKILPAFHGPRYCHHEKWDGKRLSARSQRWADPARGSYFRLFFSVQLADFLEI